MPIYGYTVYLCLLSYDTIVVQQLCTVLVTTCRRFQRRSSDLQEQCTLVTAREDLDFVDGVDGQVVAHHHLRHDAVRGAHGRVLAERVEQHAVRVARHALLVVLTSERRYRRLRVGRRRAACCQRLQFVGRRERDAALLEITQRLSYMINDYMIMNDITVTVNKISSRMDECSVERHDRRRRRM